MPPEPPRRPTCSLSSGQKPPPYPPTGCSPQKLSVRSPLSARPFLQRPLCGPTVFLHCPPPGGYTIAHTGKRHRKIARAAGAKCPWASVAGPPATWQAALGRRGIPSKGCERRAVPFFSAPATPGMPVQRDESLSSADQCHFLKGVFGASKAASPGGKPAFCPVFSPRFQGHRAAPLFPKYPILRLLFSTDIDIMNKIDADPRSWRTRCTNE